ncbi:MAG: hypothetical protein GF409_04595 [Candidatus Omnitrophica bacterium]|nr:hypothetical protein [Candidatus Omnitrophota bacterium]
MVLTKRKMFIFAVLAAMAVGLMAGEACGDEELVFNITSKVDRSKVNIGDPIKLEIKAEGASGYKLVFPEKPQELGEFSLMRSRPIEEGRAERIVGREYVLGIYTTGLHVIPPVEVMYRSEGSGGDWLKAKSPQVPMDVRSLLTGDDTDIKDLKGLAFLGGGSPGLLLFLIVLVLVGAAAWFFWKRRWQHIEQAQMRERTAYEIAHEELSRLKAMDLAGKGRVKEYYTRLSDIVRRYLEKRFSYRAPEMTTEEFLRELKTSPLIQNEHKELLKDFLSKCDMVKFAKYGPTPIETIDSFKAAEKLVEQTREVEKEEVEA